MKILAANKFYYIFGGSDRYYFELNKLHEKAGHAVVPFAMHHPENLTSPYADYFVSEVNYWNRPNMVDKLKAAGRVLYSAEARRKIKALIKATQPDLAHIHLIYHQISPSIVPEIKAAGIPIVQTLHDYKPICPTYSFVSNGEICERCKGGKYYQAALQRCNHGSLLASGINSVEMYFHHALRWYDLPDMYITPSNFMREKMIEFGMPANKLVHIPNFVDPDQHRFSPEMGDYFVYLGRLAPIKGVKTLLYAMSKLKSKRARLLLIGDGPQRAELEALKAELHLDQVEFCGYQTAAALANLLSNAMFNILPSEVYENCPMSVLEMMAIGKPTLGARIGGIPELIRAGETGLLFQSGNADDLAAKIDQLLSNPQLCRQMGGRGRKIMETNYNPNIHYEQVMSIYERVL